MRKLLICLAFAPLACTAVQPPKPAPVPPPAVTVHDLTLTEEAQILALEDRREFDPALAAEWSHDPNPLKRTRLALALGRIGPYTFVDANNNGERDPGERQAGVAELETMSDDGDAGVRQMVAFALGEIGDASSIETLFKLATDSNATVAAEAAEALSKMAKDVPIVRYAALTTSGAEGPRGRAIRFLFRFNSDEASAAAANQLGSDLAPIRQEAAYALMRRPYAPAREKLDLLTSDANVLTRAYAIAALGRIGARESMPAIVRALGDAHPWVRTNALVAVGRVAAKDASVLTSDDVPRMLALTEDPDPGTRASAVDTLGWYATVNDAARARLLDIAANGSRWEREIAAGAIAAHFGDAQPSMIPSALTPWAIVRVLDASAKLKVSGAAIRKKYASSTDVLVRENAIGDVPDDQVDAEMDIIRPGLDDPDPIVRANAIGRYEQSKSADVAVLRAAEERARKDPLDDARLAAIGGIVDEAFWRSLLKDNDPVVRHAAADLIEEKLKKPRPQYTPLPVTNDYAAIATWAASPHTATIHMTRGNIEIALLPHDAPVTAWNFAQLAQKHYFDDTSFMRVVPNFVIQGGDPRNDQNGGPGYAIRDEINLQKYTRGAVGMALSGPDTGGSQFFITHSPQPHLDGGYTIFGRVSAGMDSVVDQTERGDRVETITIDERR